MLARPQPLFSKDAFYSWLAGQDCRYELIRGTPVMLPYVTRNHQKIVTTLAVALAHALDLSQYNVTTGDFAVETGPDTVRFADVMVEAAGGPGDGRATTGAVLLVEVLSSTTAHVDCHAKLNEYLALPTLGSYLIFAQDKRRVWAWTRRDGAFAEEPEIVEGAGTSVQVPALSVSLALDSIYKYVELK